MSWLSACRGALLILAFSLGAQAQTLSRSPSAEELCMVPAAADRGTPEYPRRQLDRRDGANVDVELSFSGPDVAPRVYPIGSSGRDDFFDSVKDFVRQLRVPCMPRGAPEARIQMKFVFVPNAGRKVFYSSEDTSEEAQRRKDLLHCMQQPSRPSFTYPLGPLSRNQQGVVMITLTFTDPASPPSVQVAHDGGSDSFVTAVQPYIDQMRLPCLPAGQQLKSRINFVFKIADSDRVMLRDLDMMPFLAMVKGIAGQKVYFDLNAMACPFNLEFALRQPYDRNQVAQIGGFEPTRAAFIRWLEQLDLDVPNKYRELIMANSSVVKIPCGTLDL